MGKVSFIAPQAEYTPPVIYSQESQWEARLSVSRRFLIQTRLRSYIPASRLGTLISIRMTHAERSRPSTFAE